MVFGYLVGGSLHREGLSHQPVNMDDILTLFLNALCQAIGDGVSSAHL